mmetsp:Transcript_17052/g.53778  ORF Transcript_17052/g.53778 Transcript_17052/m.53778 type:complete len:206 (-) Transcript_17052:696-1313(-)
MERCAIVGRAPAVCEATEEREHGPRHRLEGQLGGVMPRVLTHKDAHQGAKEVDDDGQEHRGPEQHPQPCHDAVKHHPQLEEDLVADQPREPRQPAPAEDLEDQEVDVRHVLLCLVHHGKPHLHNGGESNKTIEVVPPPVFAPEVRAQPKLAHLEYCLRNEVDGEERLQHYPEFAVRRQVCSDANCKRVQQDYKARDSIQDGQGDV